MGGIFLATNLSPQSCHWVSKEAADDSQSSETQKFNRRTLLKGAAAGGAVVATESVTGFPTVWAQNTKDITLVHAGGSYAAIKEIGDQASKDLGFKIVMQAITDDVQLNRSLTQPNTIDINNIDSTKLPYLVGKGVIAPIPVEQIQAVGRDGAALHQGRVPNGKMASTQGLAPIEAMFYADKDGKKLAGKPTEFLTMIPTIYNADTLGIRPDLVGGRDKITSWKDLLDPKYKGKTALVDYAPVGVMDVAMALEVARRLQVRRQGQHDQGGDRQDHQDHDRSQEGRPFPLLLEHLRPVGEPDGLGRGGGPVDVVAGGHRRALARHRLLLRAPEGRLSRLVRRPGADGASQRAQARLRLRVHELVQLGLAGRLHRQAGLLLGGPATAKKFLTPEEWDYWYDGKPAAVDIKDPYGTLMEKKGTTRDGGAIWDRMGNIACWNTVMDEDRYLTRRWNEFVSS